MTHGTHPEATGRYFYVLALAALGVLVLPARKRKSKAEFTAKLEDLRTRLVGNLEQQFAREMRRSAQRVEDTVAPFDRFVRAERDRLTAALGPLEAMRLEPGDRVAAPAAAETISPTSVSV